VRVVGPPQRDQAVPPNCKAAKGYVVMCHAAEPSICSFEARG
jgi:hypothetical protein